MPCCPVAAAAAAAAAAVALVNEEEAAAAVASAWAGGRAASYVASLAISLETFDALLPFGGHRESDILLLPHVLPDPSRSPSPLDSIDSQLASSPRRRRIKVQRPVLIPIKAKR